MVKKFLTLFLLFVIGALQAWLSFVPSLLGLSQTSPVWWEIKLVLTAKGDYKLDEVQTSYSGNYSFTISWTGTLEKDDGDYLLYLSNCKLLEWKAQEEASQPESLKHLKTDDFVDKPSFNLIYILKKGEDLHFNFIVEGFSIPQSKSADKFYLCLPSSAENAQNVSEIDYNSFVSKGSNQISFQEDKIYTGPAEKTFAWNWKNQKWRLLQSRTVFFSNRHQVSVDISIIPHF